MNTISITTRIEAPVERCFLLSLSVDLHVESTSQTGEQAIAGVTHGLMALGEQVTLRGRHFGLILEHESLITRYEQPDYFQDVMVRGMFKSFVHDHWFSSCADGGTLMRDRLSFAAPLGVLGVIAESLVLRRYLRGFLIERNETIRRVAEGPPESWQRYLEDYPR